MVRTCARYACAGALLLVVIFSVAGCASTTPVKPRSAVQWPSAPEPPRIVWEKEVRTGEDAGISRSFMQSLAGFFFGDPVSGIGKPYGLHVAGGGKAVFVVDVGRALVHVFDREGKRHWMIGQGKDNTREFNTPIGITSDDGGFLYITDSGRGIVFRCRLADGVLEPFITKGIQRPTGIAYSKRKKVLYVTDTLAHQVFAYSLDGNLSFRIGSRGSELGEFNYPTDLCIDASGRLYISDALNNRIQVFTEDGRFLRSFGTAGDTAGYFAKPKGLGVDSDGNIYVVDALFDSVQIFNEEGQLLLDFGGHGSSPGQLWLPSGLFIDENDRIYVADTYNQRIQIFRYVKPSTPR